MSAVAITPAAAARASSVLAQLARKEIRRYATHPLFLLGLLLVAVTCAQPPDGQMSSLGQVIVPAAGFGVLGLVVMASLVRGSDRAAGSAGVVASGERTRTLALACAVVVPLAAALLWFGWAVWAYHRWPTPPNGLPFGGFGDSWGYAVLVALGVLPAVGGPLLGLVVARWLSLRGAAPVSAVLLVLGTIMVQGLFEPIRYVRVFAPWTYFGGPFGIAGDPERMLILTGSPHWYAGYLTTLCGVAALVAVLHDPEAPRRRLLVALAVVAGTALVLGTLAMTQGVQVTMTNPLPSTRP